MDTRQQHTAGNNRSTHPQRCTTAVQQHYSSTAVKPTKRSTHPHDIVIQQYRKGFTAVVDRCGFISLNPTHGTSLFRIVIFVAILVETRMLTSRCMLPSLRSAPYPALCPCEPRRPVGDMQAASCGARSRQYSRLLPASSSQPRSIVERAGSGPMGRVHISILRVCIYRYVIRAVATPSARRV